MNDPTWGEAAASVVGLVSKFDPVVSTLADWTNGTVDGGPNGDGTYPFTQVDGTVFYLPCPAKLQSVGSPGEIYPDMFDPLAGSGPAHDDLPAFRAMLANALVTGRKPCGRSNVTYYVSDTIEFDPSRYGFEGNGCVIDGRLKTFLDPAAQPALIDNPTFANGGAGWYLGQATTLAPTFDANGLEFSPGSGPDNTDPAAYFEVGRQIIAPIGSTIAVSITINSLRNTQDREVINTFRTLVLSFRANVANRTPAQIITSGPNATGGTNRTISNAAAEYADGVTITWQVTLTSANPWLRIQSNAGCSIAAVQVRNVPLNAVMLVRSPTMALGGRQRGHNYHEFCNFKVSGKAGAQAAFADGIFFDTLVNSFASRAMFRNVDVSDNLNRAVILGNRTYLNVFVNCRLVARSISVDTIRGSLDAGENISFFGGNMGGGLIGIRNDAGFNINCYGVSIDFPRQWYVGRGGLFFDGWLEMNETAIVADFPVVDVQTGHCKFRCRFQGDGEVVTRLVAPFHVGPDGILEMEATPIYGFLGTSEALCNGEGRFLFRSLGAADKSIDNISKRDDTHNILGKVGSFEPTTALIGRVPTDSTEPAMLSWAIVDGQEQLTRHLIGFRTNAAITGDVTQGERAIINTTTAPTAAIVQAEIVSADAQPGTRISGVQNSGSITCSTTTGSNILTLVSPAPNNALANNKYISGPGIPPGTRIIAYNNGAATITMDHAATATSAGVPVTMSNIVLLSQPWNGPSAAGQRIPYRTQIVTASGTIAGDATRGTDAIRSVAPGEYTMTGTIITDPNYPANTVVRWYDAATQTLYLSGRRTGATQNAAVIGYQKAARAGMVLSGEAARVGTQSMKLFKHGINATTFIAHFAIPLRPNRTFGGEFFYKVPASPAFAADAKTIVFVSGFMAQLSHGQGLVPIVGQSTFVTDQPQRDIDLHAGQDWTRVTFGTTRYDVTSSHDGYAAEWGTHFVVLINLASVPDHFEMFVDDFHGNPL